LRKIEWQWKFEGGEKFWTKKSDQSKPHNKILQNEKRLWKII
jgi:hypothetical protein